jgi:hypothetical protein
VRELEFADDGADIGRAFEHPTELPERVRAGTDGRSDRKREADRETNADHVSCARHKGMSVHNAADSAIGD